MAVLIIIPTYNEKENIPLIVPQIFSVLSGAEVLIVDDNSPDGTADIVRQLQSSYPKLELMTRTGQRGLGSAYREALEAIREREDIDLVITMDADGSHDPQYLPALVDKATQADVVIGSRYIKGGQIADWNWIRRLISRFGNWYARVVTGLPVRDLTSGYICFRRGSLKTVDLSLIQASGFSFLIGLKYGLVKQSGARVAELPIVFKERVIGTTKFNSRIFFEGFILPWKMIYYHYVTGSNK